MASADATFYGFEQKGSNLFKLYIAEGALCGARIAGAIYDDGTARVVTMHFGLLGLLVNKVLSSRALRQREAAEAQLATIHIGGPAFLAAHKRNFSIGAGSITRAAVNQKQGKMNKLMGAAPTLELQLLDGSKRSFALVQHQDPHTVRTAMTRLVPQVEMIF